MKRVSIDSYRRINNDKRDGDGQTITLCISFCKSGTPKPRPLTEFDTDLGVWLKKHHTKKNISSDDSTGGIAFVDVPTDIMKHYVKDLKDFLLYAYTAGGAKLKLIDDKSFRLTSIDKKMSTVISFGVEDPSFVVSMPKKITLGSHHVKVLLDYLTNNRAVFDDPF